MCDVTHHKAFRPEICEHPQMGENEPRGSVCFYNSTAAVCLRLTGDGVKQYIFTYWLIH